MKVVPTGEEADDLLALEVLQAKDAGPARLADAPLGQFVQQGPSHVPGGLVLLVDLLSLLRGSRFRTRCLIVLHLLKPPDDFRVF